MAIDLEEELKKAGGNPAATGGKPFGPNVPTLGQGLTGMSSAISGIGVSNPPPAAAPVNENYSNEGRSVPVPITKDVPGIVVDNNFNVAGKEYTSAPTSQPGVQRITAPGTSPLYTNIERSAAVAGLNNKMIGGDATTVQEGLNRYANENKIRGEMIGAMSPSGGSGVYVLGEVAPGMTQNDVDNAEKTARWRRDDLMDKMKSGSPADKAALASIINNEMSVGAQLRGQDLSASSAARGHDLTGRGQDMQERRAAAHDATIMRGQDLTSAETAARLGLDKERLGILQADAARMGSRTALENTKTQGEIDDQKMLREARAGLTSAIASGDPRKIEQARAAAVAAGIKFDKPDVSADYKPDGMGMGGTAVQRNPDGSLITTRIGADGKVAPPVRIAAPGATMAQKPVPAGHFVVGTSGGKRVLQDASGKRFIESE